MILGFIGRRGSGKSLSMIKQAYADYLNGKTIYSNIYLSFPYVELTKDTLLDFANEDNALSNCTVLIDELHMYMDSRLSASKRNLLISYFLLQTRKRSVDVYFTTQNISQVDKRMRQQLDIVISCTSNEHEEVLYVRNIIIDMESKQTQEIYFIGNEYFELYNTDEIVGF